MKSYLRITDSKYITRSDELKAIEVLALLPLPLYAYGRNAACRALRTGRHKTNFVSAFVEPAPIVSDNIRATGLLLYGTLGAYTLGLAAIVVDPGHVSLACAAGALAGPNLMGLAGGAYYDLPILFRAVAEGTTSFLKRPVSEILPCFPKEAAPK
jgi:hypothetical protein